MLSYSARPGGEDAIITPPAEIDLTNAGQFGDELNAALDRGITTLIVDMSKTMFCDSAGAAALVHAHKRASTMNADLRLVMLSESHVRRVFEINGMDQIMQICTSQDAARCDTADIEPERPCP
jgi:anti-sigma B factor antagonist